MQKISGQTEIRRWHALGGLKSKRVKTKTNQPDGVRRNTFSFPKPHSTHTKASRGVAKILEKGKIRTRFSFPQQEYKTLGIKTLKIM